MPLGVGRARPLRDIDGDPRAEQRAAKNGGPDRTSYEGSRAAGACEAPPEGNSSGFDYAGLSGPDWTALD